MQFVIKIPGEELGRPVTPDDDSLTWVRARAQTRPNHLAIVV